MESFATFVGIGRYSSIDLVARIGTCFIRACYGGYAGDKDGLPWLALDANVFAIATYGCAFAMTS